MGTKKYELLQDDTKERLGRKLYRIKALITIGLSVAAGDVGGYVESEKNLSQSGDAWVSGNAQVYGNARVQKPADIQTYSGVGSSSGTLTAYRTTDGIELTRGCFHGDLPKFRAAVEKIHGKESKYGKTYLALADAIELWFADAPVAQKEAA